MPGDDLYPFDLPESEPDGSGPVTRRWIEQRWLVDAMVRANGIGRAQPRLDAIAQAVGAAGDADVEEIARRATTHDSIPLAFADAADGRRARAEQAESDGRTEVARADYLAAANFYAAAQWGIAERSDRNLELNHRKRSSYARYATVADHPVEAVWVPFGPVALPAWLHLPPGAGQDPLPLVVSIPGMDGFKERFVPLHGDLWLERGVAVLVLEGPGQFESAVLGIRLQVEEWTSVGTAVMDWVATRPDLDPASVGLVGSSLGSLLGTIAVAHEPRIRACAVSATAFEPGLRPGFDSVHPFYKVRLMFLTGIYDEDEFERYRDVFTWEGHVSLMDRPYLVVGGEHDPMSPLAHTRRAVQEATGPRRLVVYEGAAHGIGGSPAAANGPDFRTLMADWMVARLAGEPSTSSEWFVQSNGQVRESPLG